MLISLVIPVYNSNDILPELVNKITKNLTEKFEIILVNDFSKDNSWKTIKEITETNHFVKGINLKENYGQHNAISAGLNYANGKYIILMDDDLQHDPIYINDIINELHKGYEACYVKYLYRKHVYWKRLVSKLNHLTSSILAGKSTKIYTSSFKGFNRRICNIINSDKNNEVFLDWIIINNSRKINSINITHKERLSGKTNYNLKKLLILWSSMIMTIKSKNIYSIFIVSLLKFFIKYILYTLISKKKFNEKFIISDKTF